MTRVGLERLIHGETRDEYLAAHDAMKANSEIWRSLAFAGIQHDGQGKLADLRHCPFCQSTLLRPIAPAEALLLCQMQAEIHARSMGAVADAVEVVGQAQPPGRSRKTAATVTSSKPLAEQQAGIGSVGQA